MVLKLYADNNKTTLLKEVDLNKCEMIGKTSTEDEYRATINYENEVQALTTTPDDKWVNIFDSFFENVNKNENEEVFQPPRKTSSCESISLENLQRELQAEIKRLESKKGGLGMKVAAITNKYDRAQLAAKQELLRQQTSLRMRKVSTQLKIDSMHDYLKKQFRKSTGTPNNEYIEKQVEELRGKLEVINNNLNETEQDEASTVESINSMLAREMGALQSLYGNSQRDPADRLSKGQGDAMPRSASVDDPTYHARFRSNSTDGNIVFRDVQKVERRKGKFLRRLSNMFRNSVQGPYENDLSQFNFTNAPANSPISKSESDTAVPTRYGQDFADGLNLSIPLLRKTASNDCLNINNNRMIKLGLVTPSPQSSFDNGSMESLDSPLCDLKEIRPETMEIIDGFEKMIQSHLQSHQTDTLWD